nr:putative reverse transcriptase domain-containing protein [Tanacetum cinerariifolium]
MDNGLHDDPESRRRQIFFFRKKRKLVPRFVEPFEIIKKVGYVAYRLNLPEELDGVHDTFHVSNFKKCLADPTLQVPLDEIRVDNKLNFMEEPVKIIEREFKKLKRSRIAIVKVGRVDYRLDLPEELNGVHDTFYVSNLKKCLANPTLQVPSNEIRVDAKLNFMEEPMEILEREFKKLKRSRIAIVKVRWNSKRGPEFTWEREDQMKLKRFDTSYPTGGHGVSAKEIRRIGNWSNVFSCEIKALKRRIFLVGYGVLEDHQTSLNIHRFHLPRTTTSSHILIVVEAEPKLEEANEKVGSREGIDVVVPAESIRAISKRFINTAYGFFLGKRVAYPVVANLLGTLRVKLHGVPVTAFSKDDLSANATNLANVELKDNIVEECPKNIRLGVAKNLKKPSQTSRGVLVGPTSNTPIIGKIEKFEDLLIDGEAILVDEAGNPFKKVECPGDYDKEDEKHV